MYSLLTVPSIFQIETTSYCNLKCVMCPHPIMVRDGIRQQHHMDLDLFITILRRDCKNTKTLGLHILGEPLLHPNIVEMVSLATAQGIEPEFATNGTVITHELASGLIRAGLSKIWFSFDGGTKETYESIRVNANFDKVVANVGLFLSVKAELGSDIPVILQMVLQPGLEADEEPFRALWEGREGVDKVAIKFLDSWAGTLFERDVPRPPVERHPCAEPFARVAVLTNGDVVPCCRDWAGAYVYGNLAEQSLEQVWAGDRAVAMRREHVEGKYKTEPCLSCKEWHIPMNRDVTVNPESGNEKWAGK